MRGAVGSNGKHVPPSPSKSRSWLGRTLRPMARGSLRGCIFTLMSAAIGPGCLLLPYMFRLVGVPVGIFVLVCGCYTSAQSLRFIITLAYLTGRDSYTASVSAVLGPVAGAILLHITTFVLLLGTGGHLKCLADVLRSLLPIDLQGHAQVIAVGIVFPLCARRDISFLRHVALIAPLGLLYVLILILVRGVGNPSEEEGASMTMELLRSGDGGFRQFPRAWSVVVNALTCHHLAVPVYKELHCARASRVNKVVLRAMAVITLLYALVGTCGFLTHGTETPENFLLVYGQRDPAGLLAKAFICCSLAVSAPLNIHALRGHLLETLPPSISVRMKSLQGPYFVLSMGLLESVPAGICSAFRSVTDIVGVCVGFGLVTYMFVMPAAALCALRWGACPELSKGSQKPDMQRTGSNESFQGMLLSSPLSSPLLSPRLGSMVSQDLPELEELLPPAAEEEVPLDAGSGELSPVFRMESLVCEDMPVPSAPKCSSGSCSPLPQRRGTSKSPGSVSPSPSDDGYMPSAPRWGSEFPLAVGAMALGSCLGFAAALDSLGKLLGVQ